MLIWKIPGPYCLNSHYVGTVDISYIIYIPYTIRLVYQHFYLESQSSWISIYLTIGNCCSKPNLDMYQTTTLATLRTSFDIFRLNWNMYMWWNYTMFFYATTISNYLILGIYFCLCLEICHQKSKWLGLMIFLSRPSFWTRWK